MKASVFVGTSVDGFIARPNGDLDWLPAGGGEPHGYDEFIESVDTIVIGRKTFDTVLTFGTWRISHLIWHRASAPPAEPRCEPCGQP